MAEQWWASYGTALAPYLVLLRLLIDDRISGAEYELLFLRMYKKDPTLWSDDLFQILDGLFADADEFSADVLLRADANGIGELELKRRASIAYERLRSMT